MRNASRTKWMVAFWAATCLCAFAVRLPGQQTQRSSFPVAGIQDWSFHHVVYPRFGPMASIQAVARDPRAAFIWRRAAPGGLGGTRDNRFLDRLGVRRDSERDWAINLGSAGTAAAMYPAKFGFDVTVAANCTSDYVVFPVNAKGGATQPNIVAFNNLYSGTAGGNGVCNRTPSGSDTGTAGTVLWSYNVQGITGGGAAATSPVISFDPTGTTASGTKIAFVESATGSPAHFHVLAFANKDGQNAGNLQGVLTPKTISSFVTFPPAAGSGTATDLTLGSSTTGTDTRSSPFVDYQRDLAYVGNDIGVLYRVKNVFCTGVSSSCGGALKPAPSLDTTWGTGGAVTVCSGKLTGPVLDFVTLNVFVGCSDGKLYMVTQAGVVTSLTIGNGSATGGVVDSPVVDGVDGFVYAVSGSNGTNAVLVQATTKLASPKTVTLGAAGVFNLHAPTFNNAYFTSPTTTGALIYVAAYNTAGNEIELYGYCFNSSSVLANCPGVTPAGPNTLVLNSTPGSQLEYAPLTEFYNANTANDWLFVTVLANRSPNIGLFSINSFPTSQTPVPGVQEGSGTTGMVVDNDSASAQASSVYFGALSTTAACAAGGTGGCAVKLTQAGLN